MPIPLMLSHTFEPKTHILLYRLGLHRDATDHLWAVEDITTGGRQLYAIFQAPGGQTRIYNRHGVQVGDGWELIQEGRRTFQSKSGTTSGQGLKEEGGKRTAETTRGYDATVWAATVRSGKFPYWHQTNAFKELDLPIDRLGGSEDGLRYIEFHSPTLDLNRAHNVERLVKNGSILDRVLKGVTESIDPPAELVAEAVGELVPVVTPAEPETPAAPQLSTALVVVETTPLATAALIDLEAAAAWYREEVATLLSLREELVRMGLVVTHNPDGSIASIKAAVQRIEMVDL